MASYGIVAVQEPAATALCAAAMPRTRSQYKLCGASLLVDGSIQAMWLTLDRNASLVNPPAAPDRRLNERELRIRRLSNCGTYQITHRMIVV